MQYILSQEEMEKAQQEAKLLRRYPSIESLQEFCTMVANTVLVTHGWYKDKVWGCILTVKREWYCDDCPARHICPHPNKHFSK